MLGSWTLLESTEISEKGNLFIQSGLLTEVAPATQAGGVDWMKNSQR